ncbi:MAG: hypothetical protein V4492_08370 [Chlamydiota bacterium]
MLWCRNFSLLSPQMLAEKEHRGLLLQFLLSDLFEAEKAFSNGADWVWILSSHPSMIPYDWAMRTGYLNKVQEHAILLKESFPELPRKFQALERILNKHLHPQIKNSSDSFYAVIRKIYLALEPFLLLCKENENLLFFLLKNKSVLDRMMQKDSLKGFLAKAYPEGMDKLGEKMCDRYHRRGFFSQIPEFKLLLSDLG